MRTQQLPGPVDYDNREYVDAWDEVSLWCSRFGTLLLDNIELRPNTVGLDLACGTGFPVLELAQIHGPSCRFVGVDRWNHALERAETKRVRHEVANVTFIQADGARLPFAPGSFNLITMNLGINNLADVVGVLAEAARVAQTGARFVTTSNIKGHLKEFYEVLRAVLIDARLSHRLPRVDTHEEHRLDADDLRPILARHGFTGIEAKLETFAMRFLDFDALLNHLLTRIGFLPGWREIVPREREVELFEEVGARLEAKGTPISLTVPMLLLQGIKG